MRQIEILAPAGSMEALQSAIYAGADAVYLGGSRFGARAYADNLDTQRMKEAIAFAHLYERKIYLTTNTLLTDQEFPELYEMVAPLYESGLDACIVQDLGVMDYLHQHFPEMDLHASTQMTLQSGRSANILKPLGVTRFVPSRELSIQEIAQCHKDTDLEIEVFVHGALCYCYSGQCLMSSMIGGRSGNRGMCAQPCRLPYTCEGKMGYWLSPKDVCTLDKIPELVDAGIDSFKIEGRMKKKEYAALTALLYREYVDFYQREGREAFSREVQKPEGGLNRDIVKLMDLFNRGGFCGGYLFEQDKKDIMYPKKNGHFGVSVGTICRTSKNRVAFQIERDIAYQDVLEIRDENEESRYEYTVKDGGSAGQIQETNTLPGSGIHIGDTVYRRRNNQLLDEIAAFPVPKVELTGSFYGRKGQEAMFSVAGKGTRITVNGEVMSKAQNRPVLAEDICKRMKRTGETEFVFTELSVDMTDDLFIPMGQLNQLRRDGIEAWKEAYLSQFYREAKKPLEELPHESDNLGIVVTICNEEQLEEALSFDKISCYHLNLANYAKKDWERLIHRITKAGKRVIISFPFCMPENWTFTCHDSIDYLINSWEMLAYVRTFKLPGKCYLDSNMYVVNQHAWKTYQKLYKMDGFTCHQDASIPVYEGGMRIVYGRIPMMITKGCLNRTLGMCNGKMEPKKIQNPKKDEFLVVNHCDYCYNMVYTSEPVRERNITQNMRFVFTTETREEVGKVLREWKL